MRKLFVVLALLLAAAPAQAIPVTFAFVAEVTSADSPLPFSAGDSFTGSFTFESTTADAQASSNVGRYDDALVALSFTLPGYSGSLDPSGPDIGGGINSPDLIVVNVGAGLYIASARFSGASFFDYDPDLFLLQGTAPFANDDLPLTPPFTAGFVGLEFDDGFGAIHLNANITSLTLVPEPASGLLLGAVAGLAFVSRRLWP